MRGEKVIVRAFGGQPLVRVIWGADEHAVYITDEEQLARMLDGKEAATPIGFRREDVFQYDPKAVPRQGKHADWSQMKPWKAKTAVHG